MDKETFINALKLSHVPRWSIIDMLKPQSVADHTYRTQIIALKLIDDLELKMNKKDVVYTILFHDIEEAVTGDMPSNHKSDNGNNLSFSINIAHSLMRLADVLEAAIWLSRYGLKPEKVAGYLESKISFLQKELSDLSLIPFYMIDKTTKNILFMGRDHD